MKAFLSHRVSYEIFNGSIPDGMVVMHMCDMPACVNPSHLMCGTQGDNMRDAFRKGRMTNVCAMHAAKTECINGHPLTSQNIRIGEGGRRICKKCRSNQGRKYRNMKKEQADAGDSNR